MSMLLIDFARELVGDLDWIPSQADFRSLDHLDWRGLDREAATALIRWCYWEPRVAPAERGFYPGGVSHAGFLDWEDDLSATMAADQEVVRAFGSPCRRLGEQLKDVLDAAQVSSAWRASASDEPFDRVRIRGLWVRLRAFRGFLRCPFVGCLFSRPRHPAPHSGIEFHLADQKAETELCGPGLAWHLITEHAFFGGKGSPYRVEPETLCTLLDVARAGE